MSTKRMYCTIAKAEEQPDGTLIVSGLASTGSVDSDGETVTPEAMKAALPDYMKFGAVREMHQPSAAGTARSASVNDAGQTEFEALIVDPVAVKKVQTGTYKGFSIGGKVTERDPADKKIIKGLKLVEVSLVDRPANPEAVISIFKAERTAEDDVNELAELLDKGAVTPADVLALVKAAQDKPAPAAEPAPSEPVAKAERGEKAETIDELRKYAGEAINDAATAIYALQSVFYLLCKEASEINTNPDQVTALTQVVESLKAFIASEIVETDANNADALMLADKGHDLAKAGAKFSAGTKQALADIHKGIKDCCDKMDALGYAAADGDEDDVAMAAAGADLAKVSGELELAKADLAKISAERDALTKRVKELEALPAPGKALLKVLAKGEDLAGAADSLLKIEPVRDSTGDINEAATLIKAAYRLGGHRLTPQPT